MPLPGDCRQQALRGVKMALYNNYLLDKKSYPSDVLGGKRLLSDYKGAPSRNKKKPEAADKQGVTIAKG